VLECGCPHPRTSAGRTRGAAGAGQTRRARAAIVRLPGQGEALFGGRIVLKTALPELTITESLFPDARPGADPHLHRENADTLYVLEGELAFLVADEEHVIGPGATVCAPPCVVPARDQRAAGRLASSVKVRGGGRCPGRRRAVTVLLRRSYFVWMQPEAALLQFIWIFQVVRFFVSVTGCAPNIQAHLSAFSAPCPSYHALSCGSVTISLSSWPLTFASAADRPSLCDVAVSFGSQPASPSRLKKNANWTLTPPIVPVACQAKYPAVPRGLSEETG
jgi:quercetin dioxygenase-like cupin family protein